MHLTGNDSRLAQDLISALSNLFVSFFSAEMEDTNETEPVSPAQSTCRTPKQGSPRLCPPVNDGTGPVQPGEHPAPVRPSRKGVIAWLAGRTHPRDRRGPRHLRIRAFQTPRLCPACDKRVTGRGWGWTLPVACFVSLAFAAIMTLSFPVSFLSSHAMCGNMLITCATTIIAPTTSIPSCPISIGNTLINV